MGITDFKKPPLLMFMLPILLGNGCGYHIVGNDVQNSSGGTKSVFVHVLINQTEEPLLEKRLSSLISRELLTDHRVRLVNREEEAQTLLQGEITAFGESALSFDSFQRTLEYRVDLTVNIRLASPGDRTVYWKKNGIHASAEYIATPDIASTRVAKDRAIHEIGKTIGETVLFNLFNPEDSPEGITENSP